MEDHIARPHGQVLFGTPTIQPAAPEPAPAPYTGPWECYGPPSAQVCMGEPTIGPSHTPSLFPQPGWLRQGWNAFTGMF